jgi:hypothetical protein
MKKQKLIFTRDRPHVNVTIGATSILLLWGCSAPQFNRLPLGQLPIQKQQPLAEIAPANVSIQSIRVTPQAEEDTSQGGIIATDVNGDQQLDILVTRADSIAAYSLTEGELWKKTANINLSAQAEHEGLPGSQGPGMQAGDIDQDGQIEVLYLTAENSLEVLAGDSGKLKYQAELPAVDSAFNRWEHAIIADFTGQGDNDILLQASQDTDKKDYIRDNVQAAFKIADLISSGAQARPLWRTEKFVSLSHGSAKVIDLDQDGKDEVVGATILNSQGQELYTAEIGNTSFPHIDAIAIDDIDPNRPGLEVVIPEETGKKRVILFDEEGTIWSDRHREKTDDDDGDKVSIGNFDPDSPGLEMWFRGNESAHFTALSATGQLIASYRFTDYRPEQWSEKGLEVINRIRWTGEAKDYIVAKERHEAGDVGIFDALTGQLIAQFPAQTERLYIADVGGDWREEIIILEKDSLKIIQNANPNPNPNQPKLWEQAHYRRQKMTWNYYSP